MTPEDRPERSEIRPNVILLAALAAGAIAVAALCGMDAGQLVSAYVGGIIGLAGRLLDPPPEENIPASSLKDILEAARR